MYENIDYSTITVQEYVKQYDDLYRGFGTKSAANQVSAKAGIGPKRKASNS